MDTFVGPVVSAQSLEPLEIKIGQWRGGVWLDPGGACWLLIAGLAKGDHEDWDDFYK